MTGSLETGLAHGAETGLWRAGPRMLGMWLFVLADAATFAACFLAYGYLRWTAPVWPRPFGASSLMNAGAMTVCLLASSVTMALAVRAARRKDARGFGRSMILTVAAGLVFLALHAREWHVLLSRLHVTLNSNPWGVPLFGAAFYTITGLHMGHVVAGVIYLSVVGLRFRRGTLDAEDVAVSGIYWQFVDSVWLSVFALVYLASGRP